MYSRSGSANAGQLMDQFMNTRHDDCTSVNDYANKLENIQKELQRLGHQFPRAYFIHFFLRNLNKSFGSWVAQIRFSNEDIMRKGYEIEIGELRRRATEFEETLRRSNTRGVLAAASTPRSAEDRYAELQKQFNAARQLVRCAKCGRTGHPTNQHKDFTPRGLYPKQRRGRAKPVYGASAPPATASRRTNISPHALHALPTQHESPQVRLDDVKP
ncbi:MAG: hypothetical protein M1828_002032 [Chrysothrix sp. TS-e1954]|nr:MAG: hypothetical protein M1828_002032 [Chrysothrix sp. TS-e1954]